MRRPAFIIACLVACVCAAIAPAKAVDSADRFISRTFLRFTSFGSISYVRFAYNEDTAQQYANVVRIQQDTCLELPVQSEHWFRLNHYLVPEAGRVAYFSIRVVLHGTAERDGALTLYRNEDWYRRQGTGFEKQGKLDLFDSQVAMSIPDFLTFHLRTSATGDAQINGSDVVSEFHADYFKHNLLGNLSDLHDSWDDRFLFREIDVAANGPRRRLLVLNLKFTATSNYNSTNSPVFHFDPGDAESADIFVASPDIREGNDDYKLRVVMKGQC